MKNIISTLILAGVLFWMGGTSLAESITLGTSDDSWVNGNLPSDNYGSLTSMRLRYQNSSWGNNYALAKFDLSALPANITINSVRMRYFISLTDWPTGGANFAPVAIFKNTQAWGESTVTFNTAPGYDATATETLDHFGRVGIDAVYFTGANTITGGGWLEYTGADSVALVQGWVDGTLPNHGVTVQATGAFLSDARRFDLQAREHSNSGVRPQLIVDYTPNSTPSPPSYTDWAAGWGVSLGDETDDYDGDGLVNIAEFALDGDPTNALDQGTAPVFEMVEGSNMARYIHPQRSDPESGLVYSLQLCTNLVEGSWSGDGYTVTGTNVTGGTLDFVSNTTDRVEDQKFIRLMISYISASSFNVKDYGALGDGSTDDTAAILSTIAAADAADSPADVVFPAGSYRISSTTEYALQLQNITDVRLMGYGSSSVLLISNPENGGIRFADSTNVAVQGLVIDYDPVPFTQGTITAVDTAAGTFDLLIDSGYPLLSDPAFSNAQSKWGLTVDLEREAYGLWAYFSSSWTPLFGNQKWRMTADNPDYLRAHPLSVGDRYVHMARRWTAFDVEFNFCKNATIKEVAIHAAAGLTTGIYYSSGVVIDGLRVELKPGSNRLISTNGDGVHSAGATGGILIENCSFVGMPDDGINIHGRGGPIISNITDTVKWVGMQRPAFYAAGDEIQILNNAAGGIRGNATLLNAVRLNDYVWEITLDTPMPNLAASWSTGDKLNPISRCGQDSVIRNNFFGAHRGREVLVQSHDITITNNHFRNPSLAWESVSLHNDYSYYSEGPAPYNVDILDNIFEGGTNQWSWSSPAIGIHSYLPGQIQTPTYDSWNINIENNTFINIDGAALEATSVSNVWMAGNTVDTTLGIKVASTPVVKLAHADDIQITDLDITDPNPATYAGVHIQSTVPSTPGAVVIVNLTANLAAGNPDVKDDR